MKNKYIKIILALSFVGIFSCETVDLDLTKSPNQVSVDNLDPDFLFNNVQLSFANFVENVAGVQSFTAQVSRHFAMTGGNTYENAFSPISYTGIWSSAYSGTLEDIAALEPIATDLDLKYHLGVSKLMKAYVYITLTDLFGDVPYTEALLGNANLNPKADSQIEIYKAMLIEIDEAIALLQGVSATYPPEDFFYSDAGTVNASTQASWITAANSFKLRVLNNARLAGGDLGIDIPSAINAILATNNIIDTPAEDWVLQYGNNRTNPNTRHPGYNNYYESSASGYMSNYLMWEMVTEKGFDDPRLTYYFYRQDTNATNENVFTLGCQGAPAPAQFAAYKSIYDPTIAMSFCVTSAPRGYWGRDHGDNGGIPPDNEKRTIYGLYPVGGKYDDGSGEGMENEGSDGKLGAGITPILTSFNMDFIRAESSLTSGTSGDPAVLLENAVRGSMSKVIGFLGEAGTASANDINNYVDFVNAAYTAASNTNERLELIMKENHIAAFGNGLEVYNAYRRTGMPSNMQPTLIPNSGEFYNSAVYPSNYVNLNSNATQKARTERIFWDKNNITLH